MQLAVLGRLRPLYWETPEAAYAIALALAVTEGPFSSDDELGAPTGSSNSRYSRLDHALWFQPELQFEYETRGGFHLVVTGAGAAFLLNGGAAQCKERPTSSVNGDTGAGCATSSALGAFMLETGYALP